MMRDLMIRLPVSAGPTSAWAAFYVPEIRNYWDKCKAVRPGPSDWAKIRPHKSRIVQLTIFRWFLSFAVVV